MARGERLEPDEFDRTASPSLSLLPPRWGEGAPEGRMRGRSCELNHPSPGAPRPLRPLPAVAGRGQKGRVSLDPRLWRCHWCPTAQTGLPERMEVVQRPTPVPDLQFAAGC